MPKEFYNKMKIIYVFMPLFFISRKNLCQLLFSLFGYIIKNERGENNETLHCFFWNRFQKVK